MNTECHGPREWRHQVGPAVFLDGDDGLSAWPGVSAESEHRDAGIDSRHHDSRLVRRYLQRRGAGGTPPGGRRAAASAFQWEDEVQNGGSEHGFSVDTASDTICRMREVKRISALLGAAAVIGMGGMTVACTPRTENPADTTTSNPQAPSADPDPTEKGLRTNVTRTPMSASPGGGAGGNAAVPCGFGPAGGGPCGRN